MQIEIDESRLKLIKQIKQIKLEIRIHQLEQISADLSR